MPLVTIGLPCYNSERFLAQSIGLDRLFVKDESLIMVPLGPVERLGVELQELELGRPAGTVRSVSVEAWHTAHSSDARSTTVPTSSRFDEAMIRPCLSNSRTCRPSSRATGSSA